MEIYQRNNSVSIFLVGNLFFGTHFSFVKPLVFNYFFLPKKLATDDEITNERYTDGCIPSVN
jgi:hypothetical protein